MNDIQSIIDRQLGIYSRFSYDNVLKRLVVHSDESFYGLQSDPLSIHSEQDPPIFACRFSEAPGYEHILALANEDGRVAIQDTTTVKSASTLEGFQCHNNAVFDLAWMPRHMNFVTVSGDHTACLWDVAESAPKRVLTFSHHTKSVKTAVFRPAEPSVFATGARDGHILLWDVRAGCRPAGALRPDNCLTGCHSGCAPKTPGSHGKRARLDTHRAASITGLVFQNDLTLVSCGECDGNIKAWDLRKNYTAYKREPLPKHSIPYCGSSTRHGYTNLIVDEARVRLYASCMDSVIYCFNVATYARLPERRYVGHESGTFYIKTGLSADCQYLVSGSSDKSAYVWNVRCSQPALRLAGHRAEVTCAAWGPRGDTKLVTCSDDARHMIWRIGPELPEPGELRGRAEAVPRADLASLPRWGGPDRTPGSLERRATTAPGSRGCKRGRARDDAPARRTKRCLADLLNATQEADEAETAIKRLRLDATPVPGDDRLLPAGSKRQGDSPENAVPSKTKHLELHPCEPDSTDWNYYVPRAGASFMSPTKSYEKRSCKVLSPRSPKAIPSTIPPRTPVKVSPSKVRVVTFATPTKNLPDFVMDGEAPHLRLMSPVRKKRDTTDWLTLMVREKKGKPAETVEKIGPVAPLSPKDSVPTRRNSATERAPKSTAKSRTLLKYFSVSSKGRD